MSAKFPRGGGSKPILSHPSKRRPKAEVNTFHWLCHSIHWHLFTPRHKQFRQNRKQFAARTRLKKLKVDRELYISPFPLLHTMKAILYNEWKTCVISCDFFSLWLYKNSKWVWSGNTTITNCRQPRGTVRKSRSTITRHHEDKLSKAISSLFPIKMIAILKWT